MSAKVDGGVRLVGYQISEQVYSGSRTQVYRAIREHDRQAVVIKLLNREYPTFSELVQFRNQYAIAKNLDISGIIHPYSLEPYHNGYALVMEDFGGISLREFTQGQPLTLEQFFNIALQLLDTLYQLHQQRVIHKDIKPANILIHPDTKQIKLIDFSIASLLPRETQEINSPQGLEGTLAYLSPEQTGRMNRGIDYRSDFYSLGVTFFELLSGKLPFESCDPMELVHCHIAKMPPKLEGRRQALTERSRSEAEGRREEIPKVLCNIISKLMAKNAEDRYQSALGIKYDLQRCWEQFQETGKIEYFAIAQQDMSDRFLIREKLYGREQEVNTLLAAFGRVANGASELMLVAGFSGIGKTAVVNEVHKPIVQQRGYFIKGKYDQFNRNIPLSAFVQALRDLMNQLLSETDTQLAAWKTKILAALGDNGQVLIEVIPELEQIIGKQPPASELSGSAAQNRFYLLFEKFMQVFTTPEHPLVIFIDDLQWADSASLQLMKLLISESKNGYLLLIGAYRDNEVSPAHPLTLILDEIKNNVKTINTIILQPLSHLKLNQLVAETLSCSEDSVFSLSQLIYQKTQGNPFFITQFLKALHEDGLIKINLEERCWQCDITQINQQALTDDVVEFMVFQLRRLPSSTQNILQLAACIGNQFDLKILAIISELSEVETAADLWSALQSGLILPQSEIYKFFLGHENQVTVENSESFIYKFLHDRIQQAAYSLIPTHEKQSVHLKIGRLLLNSTPEANREERIFAIISQLNLAAELITQPAERQALAEFNLMASRKAKVATAYVAALQYAKQGMELLVQDCWETQYNLTLELHHLATETAHLSGDLAQMQNFVSLVLNHTKTPLDQVSVYEVIIEAYTAQGRITDAIAAAITILEKLHVELPPAPTQAEVTSAFDAVSHVIAGRSPAELLHLPPARDANILAAARILTSVAPPAYLSQPLLYLVVILKKVYLSVVYGNESTSPFAYVSYGILLCGVVGNVELGYEFGQLALDLLSRDLSSQLTGKTLLLVHVYTRHGKMHLRETLQPLQMAYSSCLDVGDLAFTGYCAYNYVLYSYFAGQNLTQLESEAGAYCEALAHLKQNLTHTYSLLARQILLNFTGDADNPLVLSGEAYKEQEQLLLHEAAGDRTGLALLWLNKLIISYLFADFAPAVEQARQARQYLDALLAFIYVPIFYFYESLAQIAVFRQLSVPEQQQMLESIASNQETLKYWATHAPMNFQHKYDLVEAEWYGVSGNRGAAIEFYDHAIAGAKANGYIQEESLANELAAQFYLDWGKERIAQEYMLQAYYGYARWGAKAKVADLERRYPRLLAPILQQAHATISTNETIFTLGSVTSTSSQTSSSSSVSTALDLTAVLKAYQAISGEIELEKLLSTLLSIVIENAGADKCVFILSQSNQLQIPALAKLSGNKVDFYPMLLHPQLVEDSIDVPVGLINNVKRSLKSAVIIDANVHHLLINDPYIVRQQPKSILCSPILHQGKLLGILYLENNLTTGAFTSDRVELLNLLCAQAAISLENARLYRHSQDYAQQLTQSLAQLQASETRFQNLANNIPGVVYQFRLDANGSTSIPYVSSGCWDLYGLDPQSVIAGENSLDAMHHPEDHPAIVEALVYSTENLTPFQQEWRIILPSGAVKWVQSAARPQRQIDGATLWDGVVIDISDRKQAEASLAKEREFLNAIIQNITDGIVVCDAEGKLTLFNKATCEFHGLPLTPLPPEQWAEHFDLYHPDGQTPLSTTEIPLLRALQGEIIDNVEMVIAPKHGLKRIILSSGQAIIDASGNKLGAVAVMRDITESKKAEIALQQKSQDLQQALQDLQQAQLQMIQSEKMSALGNLVAGVAHEMNNPLGFIAASIKQAKPTIVDIVEHLKLYQESLSNPSDAILNHAEEIDLEYTLEDLPKMLDSMTMACDRLKNISTSLRTFSRADRDYKVPFNIHEGIDSTILILKHRLKANEQRPAIQVVTHYGNLPAIECFPGQLNQVFMNIIANAIDALEESNIGRSMVDIQVRPNRITITTSLTETFVKITITDNGKGIDEEVQQKIFDHLFTTKSVGKGTGLGLAIAQQIVEEIHGGKLTCHSVVGEGTKFIIAIPV